MSILSTALSMSYHYPDAPIEDSTLLSLDQEADYQQIWTLEWFWGLNKGELPLCTSLNRLELQADIMTTFKDADWMLVPTEKTMEAIELICEHNDCADEISRKSPQALSQPAYEYELRPLGFALECRRAALYATLEDGTRRAYHYPYDDLPRIRSQAHPFFVVMQAYFYAFHLAPCGTCSSVRDASTAILRITSYWRDAPPAYFIYGPKIAREHRHPLSVAGSVASKRKQAKHHKRSPDKLQYTRKTARAREGSGSSLGKRKRGSDAAHESSGASTSQLSSHALATLSADKLYTEEAIHTWMSTKDLPSGGGRCTTPEPPLDVAAALTQYATEPSRDPEETLRAGKRFKRGIIPTWQKPDTSRYCSNDWAHEKCRVHLWAPYDPQNIFL
ncbi:hypothetical protein EV715DRAFT_210290 [Schizophyllum commune]